MFAVDIFEFFLSAYFVDFKVYFVDFKCTLQASFTVFKWILDRYNNHQDDVRNKLSEDGLSIRKYVSVSRNP